jgi:DNA-binding transcriptional regulator YdaS (Cro superfamily)
MDTTRIGHTEAGSPVVELIEAFDDPLGCILAMHRHRGHLNESQRAMVAAALANMSVGRPKGQDNSATLQNYPVRQSKAAELLNVSPRLVAEAVKVRREANMRQGERTDLEPSLNVAKVSQTHAAELLNVSPALVSQGCDWLWSRPSGSSVGAELLSA